MTAVDVAEIDLLSPTATLPASHRPVRLLVWAGPRPLGEVTLAAGDGGDHARRHLVERLAAPLLARRRLVLPPAPSAVQAGAVSIVVCTRDRAALLEGCLAAATRLDPAPAEVLVVDNAPTSTATADVARRFGVRHVVEPRPGLDRARNRGWRSAVGDVVAYVDDDARAHPRFAAAVAEGFLADEVGAVTGLVLPAELATPAQRLFEAQGGMRKGYERRAFSRATSSIGLQAYRLGVGTNMALRRSVLAELGGFDDHLDVGTPTRGGGDLDVLHRVLAAGHVVVYEPAAVVRHLHRRDLGALLAQCRDNGVAYAAYLAARGEEDEGAVRRERRRWHWARHVRGPLAELRHGRVLQARLLLAEARGSLDGRRALAQSRTGAVAGGRP